MSRYFGSGLNLDVESYYPCRTSRRVFGEDIFRPVRELRWLLLNFWLVIYARSGFRRQVSLPSWKQFASLNDPKTVSPRRSPTLAGWSMFMCCRRQPLLAFLLTFGDVSSKIFRKRSCSRVPQKQSCAWIRHSFPIKMVCERWSITKDQGVVSLEAAQSKQLVRVHIDHF